MKFLIVTLNYCPEITGIGKYTTEMAEWLANRNYEVRVITAPPYYPQYKIWNGYKSAYSKIKIKNVTVFRCPLWLPLKLSPFNRIFHLVSFLISSFPIGLLQIKWKPDLILLNEPPFICAPIVLLLSLITKSKTWLHIQDFEIDIFLGLSNNRHGVISKTIRQFESIVTNKFTIVSSISKRMVEKILEKEVASNKAFLFPNWVDTTDVNSGNNKINFRKLWNINEQSFVLLYSGTIGNKQGLEIICNIASKMQDQPNLVFLIVGEGVGKQSLVKIVEQNKVSNIIFKPMQPVEALPSLLNCSDVHLVIQKKSFADSVLPSKLVTILSVGGVSLITADLNTELSNLVRDNPNIAIIVEPENEKKLIDAILSIQADKKLQQKIKSVAREFAVKNLDKESVLSAFEKQAIGLVN